MRARRPLLSRVFAAQALLTWALLSCSGANQQSAEEALPEAVDHFHGHLVWGRSAEASLYLPEGQREVFLGAQEEIGDEMRFTEYEVDSIDVDPVTGEAIVVVTLEWYREPDYTVRETRVRETWQYDDENEVWWLNERVDADLD